MRKPLSQLAHGDIEYVGAGYRLRLEPDLVDAIRFERLLSEARSAASPIDGVRLLDAALSLWNANPFGNCRLDALEPHRQRLLRGRSAARVAWAEASFNAGDQKAARARVEEFALDEPANERLWFHLAALTYLGGEPVQALRLVDRVRTELVDAVGVTLGPELRDLESAILSHDNVLECYRRHGGVSGSVAVSHNAPSVRLPQWAGELVDREAEIAAICQRIESSASITSIVGPGGVGKTRCAVEAVRASHLQCFGFIDLSAVDDAKGMLTHLAGSFGCPDRDSELGAISSRLQRPGVVILDNLEQVVGAADVLSDLVEWCPEVRWVLTSRVRLGVRSEVTVRLRALDTDSVQDPSPALRCLTSAAERQGAQVAAGDAALEQIAGVLDGLPLALELAGAQLVHRTPEQLLAGLQNPVEVLVDGERNLSRHRSMRACIEFGIELLSSTARTVFQLLTVRKGGVRVDDLSEVIDDALDLTSGIGELRDACLVAVNVDHDGVERLILPSVLRGFETSPAANDDHVAVLDRAVTRRVLGAASFDTVEADLVDIRRLLRRGTMNSGFLPEAMRLGTALVVFWWARRLVEGREWCHEFIASRAAPRSGAYVHALNTAAFLDFYAGDCRAARQSLDTCLSHLDSEGPLNSAGALAAQARALSLRSMIDGAGDDPDRAQRDASRAVALARDIGSIELLAVTLGNAGDVAGAAGQYSRAAELCYESIECFRGLQTEWLAAAPYARLGDYAAAQGDNEQARLWYDRSISLWDDRVLGAGAAQTLAGLARLLISEGDTEGAADRIDTALAAAQSFGSRGEYPWVALAAAELLFSQGLRDTSVQLFSLGRFHGRRSGQLTEWSVRCHHGRLAAAAADGSVAKPSMLTAMAQTVAMEDMPDRIREALGQLT